VKLPAYREYKPSGVEWLGPIPEHWEVTRLKRVARMKAGSAITTEGLDQEGEYPVYGGNGLRGYTSTFTHEGERVLVGRQGALCGNVNYATGRFWASEHAVVVTPVSDINVRWLGELLSSMNLNQYSIAAAQPGLAIDDIQSLEVARPPLHEQRAIANFLDAETARLDTLVAKKRELVEKLKEKRSALISRSVTRGLPPEAARAAGLNPNPKFKPSGIEWLGEIPAHWEVKQLKWAIMFQRGHDLPTDDREEGSVPLVTSSGISATHAVAAAKGPGIVTGRYGTIGEFYLVREDYWPLNTTLYSIDLRGNEPRFLCYMLSHLAPLFLLNAVKSAVPGIDRNDIHSIKAVVPPPAEQRAVADYLDRETNKIDRMVAKVEEAIERLQEYRTALITAAVTGKIDVRKRAA